MTRRSGRRPGKQDTRTSILDSARWIFADQGYDSASVRQIASAAGVDPALIYHYFGTKDELFLAVVRPPIDPATLVPRIFAGGADGVAERLLRTFLSVIESPVSGPAMRSFIRGTVSRAWAGRLAREFFATQIVRRVVEELDTEVPANEIPMRASLVASQLFGLAMTRYVLELPPLCDLPAEDVVTAVAPNIQRYLTGELGIGPPDGSSSGLTPRG